MHAVILPGNSKQYNEDWLRGATRNFADVFDSVHAHTYEHWKNGTGEKHADVKLEAENLTAEISNLNGEFVIIAKSIGVPITIRAIVENGISPTKCIFLGSAFEGADEELVNLVAQVKTPVLFIEQTDDMFFPYAQLKEFLEKYWTGEYKLIEIPGQNHAYDNYDEMKSWISDFLA